MSPVLLSRLLVSSTLALILMVLDLALVRFSERRALRITEG